MIKEYFNLIKCKHSITLTVLPFWIYLFLLTLVFVLQWPTVAISLHWEILIMLLLQLSFTFRQTQQAITLFVAQLMTILVGGYF